MLGIVCSVRSTLLALLLSFGLVATIHAQQAERYQSAPPSADGIGKVYQGREIAKMMGFDGAAWLERTERQKEERADLLMAELGLKPGMEVADVGAGTGYYSRRMALQVGTKGKVYAIEVQPQMLSVLETTAKRPGYGNIVPVMGTDDDVKLPEASIDLAIMVDVYHELAYPHEVLASIVRALRPGGRMVFVEYRGEDFRVPIKPLHKMTEQQVRLEAADQALVWERTARTLPWQHVVVFRRP
ncbi:MAG: methyltransferase domain-containing protein [Burkholderiales bacterium]